MTLPTEIAQTILDGFDKHYRLFREVSAAGRQRFEDANWSAAGAASAARLELYDARVLETVEGLLARFPSAEHDEALWPATKLAYIGLLYDHRQPECAETFYNSVACRVLHRRYYSNDYIFTRPAVSTEHLDGEEPTYRVYYPASDGGLRTTLRRILLDFRLARPFRSLGRDVGYLLRAIAEHLGGTLERQPNFQIHVLSSLFYRNKAAYVVGRVINGIQVHPFVVPILQDGQRRLFVDALLLERLDLARVMSLARAYFHVDMEVPSAYVSFLETVLPGKARSDLYTLLGLQKQGKTLLYRDLQWHLRHSRDRFTFARGTRGMVMLVFTLPSWPYVFKVIRDWFEPPKTGDARHVQDRYRLVKQHDRAGRLADTLEYSNVAFPRSRFEPALLAELERLAPSRIEYEGERVVIKHLYVERRMVPLDVYLREAPEAQQRDAMRDYGLAIRELAGANIFPGDLLLKNFGVTRYGRVVFYDYDEICLLTDCRFRYLPRARDDEEEMSAEPWFHVEPDDIFPEQFPTFLVPEGRPREWFLAHHGELADPAFWMEQQRRRAVGIQEDIFPYPEALRLWRRYGTPARPATPAGPAAPLPGPPGPAAAAGPRARGGGS